MVFCCVAIERQPIIDKRCSTVWFTCVILPQRDLVCWDSRFIVREVCPVGSDAGIVSGVRQRLQDIGNSSVHTVLPLVFLMGAIFLSHFNYRILTTSTPPHTHTQKDTVISLCYSSFQKLYSILFCILINNQCRFKTIGNQSFYSIELNIWLPMTNKLGETINKTDAYILKVSCMVIWKQ